MYKKDILKIYVNRLNFISSVYPIGFKFFLPNLEIKNLSRALRILSLSKLISSYRMSSMSLMEWSGREKWSEKILSTSAVWRPKALKWPLLEFLRALLRYFEGYNLSQIMKAITIVKPLVSGSL